MNRCELVVDMSLLTGFAGYFKTEQFYKLLFCKRKRFLNKLISDV